MAGIYIHIPFCHQKCHYCNFFSVASLKKKEDVLKSIVNEMVGRKDYLGGEKISTIYFGGGTPSLLSRDDLSLLFDSLHQNFNIEPTAEITLEANPDDLDPDKLKELYTSPINRLSIGVQSFFDDDLQYLNRVHNAGQSITCLRNAQDVGFKKLTIDLIYGIPTLDHQKWHHNLNHFFNLEISHLSAYALTVENKTALKVLIDKNKVLPPDEQQTVEQFNVLMEETEKKGFIHYEISNFSKPGYYSKHNSIYWMGGHYLGLGPSAHSYNGISRQWNPSGISAYLDQKYPKVLKAEIEVLTPIQRFNEYVMTSLRTVWGCDLEHIENVFGKEYSVHALRTSKKHIEDQQIIRKGNILTLSQKGKLFADAIAADLFLD